MISLFIKNIKRTSTKLKNIQCRRFATHENLEYSGKLIRIFLKNPKMSLLITFNDCHQVQFRNLINIFREK